MSEIIKEFDETSEAREVIRYLADQVANCGTMVYRGYQKEDELLPTLYRREHSAGEYEKCEKSMLRDIYKYGAQYMPGSTGLEIVANAQHYGLPTRVLDFTWNPFVALFFALHHAGESEEGYRCVIGIDVSENVLLEDIPDRRINGESFDIGMGTTREKGRELVEYFEEINPENKVSGGDSIIASLSEKSGIDSSQREAAAEAVSERLKNGGLILIEPGWSNPRILMQQGLFLIPHSLYSHGKKSVQEVLRERLEKQMKVIKVHNALRVSLLGVLSRMGFDTYHLMPDFESACRELKGKYLEIIERKSTED